MNGLTAWWHAGDQRAHRALVAASLGWMLDAFDIMLFALLTSSVITALGITKAQAGALGSVTLLFAAGGGLLFGALADRYGRTRALMGSVLLYSVFTALCGFANSFWQLAVARALLGLGMGGEWASGAALVSETWPAAQRGKALGFVQSSWAIGYGVAALVTWIVLDQLGLTWRVAFFVGVLPAFLIVWIQRRVEESPLWLSHRTTGATGSYADVFRDGRAGVTAAVTLMNAFTLFAWWGMNAWVAARLSLAPKDGGLGMSTGAVAKLVLVNQLGMWLGYVTFGYIADAVGRKRTYIAYLLIASVLIPVYGFTQAPTPLLVLGPFVMFFGTGYFSGFGALTAELYPTAIRARAQGFTYNIGRIASAAAPFIAGTLATSRGFGVAFSVSGAAFLSAAIMWIWIPETRGRELT
ncbi:MAG TPA: MFS transporter [Gemmatimonadaceae bacterium]|nr:MFS transporter [Gemmatimonadaceae bacterium]